MLLLCWGVVGFQCLYYFPLLPGTVASHFDGAGRANGWSTKAAFFVLYLILTALMSFVFFVLPRLLGRIPTSLINLPHRDFWLAPERKQKALKMLGEDMESFGVVTMTLILCTIQLAIEANLEGGNGLRAGVMWLLVGGYLVYTGLWIIRIYRRFRIPS